MIRNHTTQNNKEIQKFRDVIGWCVGRFFGHRSRTDFTKQIFYIFIFPFIFSFRIGIVLFCHLKSCYKMNKFEQNSKSKRHFKNESHKWIYKEETSAGPACCENATLVQYFTICGTLIIGLYDIRELIILEHFPQSEIKVETICWMFVR